MRGRFLELLSLRRGGPLVGIDIGARSVKLLQLSEQHGRLFVLGAARVELPTDSQAPAPLHDYLRDQLRSIITSGMFTGRRCVVSLPRSDMFVQAVRLPSMPENELSQAAAWEASQRFNLDREKMECDYVRTGMTTQGTENREEILLVAASHERLEMQLGPIVDAGFRPIAVDTNFAALARAFSRHLRRNDDQEQVRAVLDVGYSGSTITILRGNQIAFCKLIDIGGRMFDRIVADHLQIEESASAELRSARIAMMALAGDGREQASAERVADMALDPATDRAVYEAVRPLMGKLIKEVTLCLRYYGVTFRGRSPQQIILTGGDALEPHLAETVEHTCKVESLFDDSLGTFNALLPQIRQKVHHNPGTVASWTVAAGLSMRNFASSAGISQADRAEKGQAA